MSGHIAVMLDEASFTLGDLDLSTLLEQAQKWRRYPATAPP